VLKKSWMGDATLKGGIEEEVGASSELLNAPCRCYSGAIEVRPQSSQRRYRTGSSSACPMTRALGPPQRGQITPDFGRFAIGLLLSLT
jgi:hypothetical protein